MRLAAVLCAVTPGAALAACGDSVQLVKPTPNSAFRSTYPCRLLTKDMASELLAISSLRRVGAQSFDHGEQQCIWARGRYKSVPNVLLLVVPSTRIMGGRSIAAMQRSYERGFEGRPWPGYRALRDLGDRAFLTSSGRISSEVYVEQDGRSFWLRLSLKQKPRSQPPPLKALEAMARDISARYSHPPG
jgi:hypothetical protein